MGKEKKILVVDDEENTRLGLSKILNHSGFEVITAGNGQEALDKFKQLGCALIITDMKMPILNGLSLLKEIKQITPTVEVIIITAYGEVESYLEAMNLGAFEYLNKPIKIDELKKVIGKVMERRDDVVTNS